MDYVALGVVLLVRMVETAVGYWIGKRKGRPTEGLLLGLIAGFIGWIVLAFLRPVPTGPPDPRLIADAVAKGAQYPAVAAEHPRTYSSAVAVMNAMSPWPDHPEAWLTELCRRAESGHDLDESAARIPSSLKRPMSRPTSGMQKGTGERVLRPRREMLDESCPFCGDTNIEHGVCQGCCAYKVRREWRQLEDPGPSAG